MNRLIELSEELLSGSAAIDTRNKALVALLNELHQGVHRRRGVEACGKAVRDLRDCVMGAAEADAAALPDEDRALLACLDGMLERMDTEQSNITFHGLHELRRLVLAGIRASLGEANADGAPKAAAELKVPGRRRAW